MPIGTAAGSCVIFLAFNTMASQITSLGIVFWTAYSGADQRKHQSSASLAFVRRIHRGPVNFPHKRPVTRKMFPFDDVIMLYAQRLLTVTVRINSDLELVIYYEIFTAATSSASERVCAVYVMSPDYHKSHGSWVKAIDKQREASADIQFVCIKMLHVIVCIS